MLTQFIQMCGRSVHLLPHLICLVSPFRFDPNRNSRTFTSELSCGPIQRRGVLGLDKPKLRFDLCPGC